jgi:hypothetical protein
MTFRPSDVPFDELEGENQNLRVRRNFSLSFDLHPDGFFSSSLKSKTTTVRISIEQAFVDQKFYGILQVERRRERNVEEVRNRKSWRK